MYGISKVIIELLSDYYFNKYGVDICVVCFLGIILNVIFLGGGMIDYVVDIYYFVVKGEKFICLILEGILMDMMYMLDVLNVVILLMEVDLMKLVYCNVFNIVFMSFVLEIIYVVIKKYVFDFEMEYKVDLLK